MKRLDVQILAAVLIAASELNHAARCFPSSTLLACMGETVFYALLLFVFGSPQKYKKTASGLLRTGLTGWSLQPAACARQTSPLQCPTHQQAGGPDPNLTYDGGPQFKSYQQRRFCTLTIYSFFFSVFFFFFSFFFFLYSGFVGFLLNQHPFCLAYNITNPRRHMSIQQPWR